MSRIIREGEPPNPAGLFEAADRAARKVARDAGNAALAVVRPRIPRASGQAAEQTRVRVRTDIEGHHVTVGPSKKVAWRARYFEEGTGIYGPRHRPIRPRKAKAFRLPGGIEVASVKGQRPRHTYRDSKPAADAAFQAAFEAGLRDIDAEIRRSAGGPG